MSQEFKLVPARMLLDKSTIGAIYFHCGDGAAINLEECSEGELWVRAVTDDDGKEVYGLHILTAEYPKEGSTTLVEFTAHVPPAGGEPNLNRTHEQWRLVDAKLCARQNSKAANEFLIRDAQYDIAILGGYVTRLTAENARLQSELSHSQLKLEVCEREKQKFIEANESFGNIVFEKMALQSELTKARELAGDLYEVSGTLQSITTAATVYRSPTLRNNGRAYSLNDAQSAARIALERVARIADDLAHQSTSVVNQKDK